MKTGFFSAVIAAFMLTASVGAVTASAAETTETTEVSAVYEIVGTAETTADSYEISTDEDSEDMEKFREVMNELAESGTTDVEPDYYGDPYYETEGNATLIKSEQIIYNSEEMQFIAVTTKDGHVFYVLINYSAADGQDNVYFLNRVDDYDLYALLYADDEDEDNKITPEQALQAAEAANGKVKYDDSSVPAETSEISAEVENTEETAEQPKQNNMNMNSIYLVVGVLALIGVGAAVFFMMKKKNGGKTTVETEPEYEEETRIVEDEEEINFYDDNQDE